MPRAATEPRKSRRAATRKDAYLTDIEREIEYLENLELPEGDGEPLESDWHVVQISLLDELVRQLFQGRTDFFCGGNMFIYYSLEQAHSIIQGHPLYKGPDFFVVKDVDGTKPRKSWVVWQEGGRYPDVIVELLSPSTARKDRHENKQLYERVFHTAEYFWYDVDTGELQGFRLHEGRYKPIEADEHGWLWSAELGAYFGVWEGEYRGRRYPWLRLYTADGNLVPTQAEAERQRAEAERQRAERLAQRLRELGVEPESL
jgi:Uma2 family endonuclease